MLLAAAAYGGGKRVMRFVSTGGCFSVDGKDSLEKPKTGALFSAVSVLLLLTSLLLALITWK